MVGFLINHLIYEQVCEQIFARPHFIVGGVAAKPLAHDIGTSVMPVREALIRLAQQDALDSIPSKGFFIPPLKAHYIEEAFNIARQLVAKQHSPTSDDGRAELKDAIVQNVLLSWHWEVFEWIATPSGFRAIERGQYTDFDRKFLVIASKCMAEVDWTIMRYIWGKTIHYRYYIYSNFDLYAAPVPNLTRQPNHRNEVARFVDEVFRRYARLAGIVTAQAGANQRPSPYM
ncbi:MULTISPECIES: GntR family transcriptional regulator [Sinorhizobium/Ensifer group]|uniref:GntR family transcriptional regulator n=1 Tax=Sinorhizobium/Ensifer group TaxID=227292 RepID=UPI00071C46D8|nr:MULTISPECIES: GntR family transcriptional regulator [Sinorhizobium/Ensifer group]KSV61303.1 hypothetical protein N183_37175 [Sinorhizobium sp. Sb3]MBV7522712.1 GntR family transcriptional regulator [Ensifer sp. ENS12]